MKEKKSFSSRGKKILLVASISLVSLTIGGCIGVDAAISSSSNSSISDAKNETNSGLDEIVNILKDKWYSEIYYGKEVDEDLIIHQFVGALDTSESKMLDPYTYLTKNESSSSTGVAKGKLGITLQSYYNYPIIIEVDERGNSYGKLQVGDIVVQVKDNKTNTTYSVSKESDYLTVFTNALGYPGDSVTVKVARNVDGKLTYVSEKIVLGGALATRYAYTSNDYNNIYHDNDTLMVKMTSFVDGSNGTANQLKDIFKKNDKKKMILDLRGNGGGALSAALDICDLFLGKDTYVTSLQYKDGTKSDYYTSDANYYNFDSIAILQDGSTASASELLISTLTYYLADKVTLVGSKSYGKGIASRTYSVLDGNYTLQYTCAKWLRPDGSWIGMTREGYDDIGFMPEEDYYFTQSKNLTYMNYYNGDLYFKDDSITSYKGFKNDNVYYTNQTFFAIYNQMYNTNYRTDGYYDASCMEAIKSYQAKYNIEQTGIMDEYTFIHFAKEFYNERVSLTNTYLEKANKCLN